MSFVAALTATFMSILAVGLVFPYGFPLATPLIALAFALTALNALATDRTIYYDGEFVTVYLAMCGFALLGLGMSPTLYVNVRADALNAVAGALAIPVFFRIAAAGHLGRLRRIFAVSVFLLMIPVAILCLYKFYRYLHGARLPWLGAGEGGRYPAGSALQTDYNMGALGLSVAAMAGIWVGSQVRSAWARWMVAAAVALILIAALLMGSRRFYVILAITLPATGAYGTWRLIRSGVHVATHWSFSRRLAIHMVFILGILTVGIVLVRPWIADGLFATVPHQIGRLFARADTLLEFMNTFETSRGAILERSVQIIDSFSFVNFLFGHGFDYLEILSLDSGELYPHNPLLAALLYGGVVNLALVTYILVRSASIYLGKLRLQPLLAAIFFVTLAFTSISGNTIFSNHFFLTMITLAFVLRSAAAYDRRFSSQTTPK